MPKRPTRPDFSVRNAAGSNVPLPAADPNGAPATRSAIVPLPYYVDPSVLRPGVVIYDTLDGERTPLEVLRVEPVLVCRPVAGGDVVEVYAHLAQLVDDYRTQSGQRAEAMLGDSPLARDIEADARHPGPDCDCDMCQSRIP